MDFLFASEVSKLSFLRCMGRPPYYVVFSKGKQFYELPVGFPGGRNLFKMGSTLKGKNLLLGEQILSFKS